MSVELTLEGKASLIHVQSPDASLHKEEYFARIIVDNGSIYGQERPLIYDVPLSKEQYDTLNSQINAEDFRDQVGEAEGYKVVPHIEVKCEIKITPSKGEV